MHALREHFRRRSGAATASALMLLILAAIFLAGTARAQQSFESADAAMQALLVAIQADDQSAILEILGKQYTEEIVTADWNAERPARERIAAAAKEKLEPKPIEDGRVEWILGSDEWPFPFQAVRIDDGSWHFDTGEGIQEIVDRRIGRNELTAIAIMDAYVDAQIAYAKQDHNGNEVFEYAQRLTSTKGQHDGLYWKAEAGEPESPFGPLVEGAESYLEQRAKGDPIRGYYFRVLDRQGVNPPGGAYDYVINGNMIAGFALVAYPAKYGNTGVMTFVVNQRGEIQQKAIEDTGKIEVYDPDDTWDVVEVDEAP